MARTIKLEATDDGHPRRYEITPGTPGGYQLRVVEFDGYATEHTTPHHLDAQAWLVLHGLPTGLSAALVYYSQPRN